MPDWRREPDDPLAGEVAPLWPASRLVVRDAFEGIFVPGSPGSGKSSTTLKNIAYGLLRTPNMGGVVLTAKAEETRNWLGYLRACGREADLILFNKESPHLFDVLAYLYNQPGRGAADMEGIVAFISTLMTIGQVSSGKGGDPFWERAVAFLIRIIIVLLSLAGERISIVAMHKVATSLPTATGMAETADWQKNSFCAKILRAINDRRQTLTEAQFSDLVVATRYALEQWPEIDDRTRSNILETFTGMTGRFLFEPYRTLFSSGKYTWTPEHIIFRHNILILDFPVLEMGETGRFIQTMLKLIFQMAWLRQKHTPDQQKYSFLFMDEGQLFQTKRDNEFAQVARSSMVATIYATQSISNIAEALGEAQPGSKTHAYLGNFGTKIFHASNDVLTMQYAADLIGKEYRDMPNWGGGAGGANPHVGGAQHLAYRIEPSEFSGLARPDALNPEAEVIVFKNGKSFDSTKTEKNKAGLNYLRTFFSRNIK